MADDYKLAAAPTSTPAPTPAPATAPAPTPAASARPAVPVDVRRISVIACVLLVALRLMIGWHLFYEGIWKIRSQAGGEPWTAAGYLKGSQGPFRDTFRGMVDDPDDLGKLDFDQMVARWQAWKERFVAHYGNLSEAQKANLERKIAELTGDAKSKGSTLYAWLKGNKENTGVVRSDQEGTTEHKLIGEIELYKQMLAKYEQQLNTAKQDFEQKHLDKLFADIQAKRRMLVGPVDQLTQQLESYAQKLLTLEQQSLGPVPPPASEVHTVDVRTMWSLTILGALLLVGLFSRLASFLAACLITLFYLAHPPWPGVIEPPGPEHALFVNKNLLEITACLCLAALPTGRWFGLDAWIHRFILGGRSV